MIFVKGRPANSRPGPTRPFFGPFSAVEFEVKREEPAVDLDRILARFFMEEVRSLSQRLTALERILFVGDEERGIESKDKASSDSP